MAEESRLSKLAAAAAWAVAGIVALRRNQRGWNQVIPATSAPVDYSSRAVLARPESPARPQPQPASGPSAAQCDEEPIPPQAGDGPGPDSPLQLPPTDWKDSVKRAVKEFKDDRATLTSAGMAFYWFLSIFPAMVAFVGLLGLFNASEAAIDSITRTVNRALPGEAARVLTTAIGGREAGGSLVAAFIGVALALWSASAGMVGLQMGLNVAYDVKDDRKFLKKRLVAFELMVAMLVLGGVATAFIVFGAPLGDALRDNLPFGSAFVVLWTVLRWTLGLAALIGLFATIYYLSPNRDTPKWVWVSPGGLLAGAIWLVASLGFSFYVSSFGKYGETYGSLAGVVVLLLWLYLTALAVVLGGELNAELERQSAAHKGQVPAESVAP
ncbi:MAG TPA: YihY/virulence factor BrkB family protein [Acidimicrobiales bacterium]|nr:YihY/virulence factor BrkB family protein [Acidimicrobiales bacterium]